MRTTILYLLFALASIVQLNAQSLREYIDEGLKNNVVLKEKAIAIDKALIALKEAKSLILPATNFEAQYTLAKGGRSIDLPVGDLLNPVYQSLNQMMHTDKFPIVGNVSEQLYPNNFYDTKFRTVMPIINPALKINRLIKKEEVLLNKNDLEIYQRELVKEIKIAYYNTLMANQSVHIFENVLDVANQNLKTSQALLANGKGLPAYLSRALIEVQSIEAQMQIANNGLQNAKAYFNFLLNKPLNDTIFMSSERINEPSLADIIKGPDQISNREEMKSMTLAVNINRYLVQLNRSFRMPKINSFIDLGSQGFDLKVNNRSLYYMAGLQLQIPIFSGNRNLYKVQQSMLDEKTVSLQWEQVHDQLMVAASVALNNLKAAYSDYKVSINQQEPAKSYYFLIDRGYKEGTNSFLEFLDAGKQLTEARLKLNISRFKLLSALALYERQTATYTYQ